ncbi:uncharacterized protein LOC133825047 [Humulus lupulus]|uniref:uncharacterized protein LOC133825047 n=1 Tax=Humulus lupulus TaxID=3486 RepID=UPI002B415992|nr:uncharacterized protein LOC133825047 [Humulus lupulus]
MNSLVWNVRGIGNDRTFHILRSHVVEFRPDIVFLSETLCTHSFLEIVRVKLGFVGKLVVDKVGRSGGLCLFWVAGVDVDLLEFSRFHIDVLISSHDGLKWRFTGIYGQPDHSLRKNFWKFFGRLADGYSWPWLCGGDLNEILFPYEKEGGLARPQHFMDNFRNALAKTNLVDLGYVGSPFTWFKRNGDQGLIRECLDRMLCNQRWLDLFPSSKVTHLAFWGSDHRPLLTSFHPDSLLSDNLCSKRRFFFEMAWAKEEGCGEIISQEWGSSEALDMSDIAGRLNKVAGKLSSWNHNVFKRTKKAIKNKKMMLSSLENFNNETSWKKYQIVEKELDTLVYKDEKY